MPESDAGQRPCGILSKKRKLLKKKGEPLGSNNGHAELERYLADKPPEKE